MLSFDFWRDDWGQLWAAVYNPYLLAYVWSPVRLHPISAYEELYLIKLFGLDPLKWQIFGFILRVVDSLAVSVLMYGITQSKKAAWFSGLIFAASLGGLETLTWPSANTSAIDIPIICFGLFFWIISVRHFSVKNFSLALLFVVLSVLADPGRAIILIGLFFIWDIFSLVQQFSRQKLISVSIRTFLLLLLFLSLRSIMANSGLSIDATLESSYLQITKQQSLVNNAFYSLGNLFVGWFIPVTDIGGLGAQEIPGLYGGVFFIVLIILSGILFILKRKNLFKIVLFFSLWIAFFYIPNWIFEKDIVVGTSHRYLAISNVGLVCILGLILSKIRSQIAFILFIVIMLLNIKSANSILAQESHYRSVGVVESLWDKIDKGVPQDERNSIFMYSGNDYLRGVALDWSASVPFGIRRKMKNVDDFPIATGDLSLIDKLICDRNVLRPSIGKWSIQKEKIPLSHLHDWQLNNGVLTDISVQKRAEIAKSLPCAGNK